MDGMMTEYVLMYQPVGDAMFEINSAFSKEEVMVKAKEDSNKNTRPPGVYLFKIVQRDMLDKTEEWSKGFILKLT